MPNLTCPAGHRIDLSPLPNPDGYVLIRERELENLTDQLGELCGSAKGTFVSRAYAVLSPGSSNVRQVYECPTCGRLAIFEQASDHVPSAWYARESASRENAGS